METQNFTLRLPKTLLQRAKRLASERGISITKLVIENLTRAISGDETYQQAWQRQRNLMESSTPHRKPGETLPTRDEIHDRNLQIPSGTH